MDNFKSSVKFPQTVSAWDRNPFLSTGTAAPTLYLLSIMLVMYYLHIEILFPLQ